MKIFIRTMSLIMALILCLAVIPFSAQAKTAGGKVIASGKCGVKVNWSLTDDGVMTISGKGDMYNYRPYSSEETSSDFVPWVDRYNKYYNCSVIKRVVVEEGVTHIGAHTFDRCIYLNDVVLPEGLKSIGDGAFRKCRSIEEIELPASITSLGKYVFAYCLSLKSFKIPDGLSRISESLLLKCEALTEVEIPAGITEIGSGAFAHCASLSSIIIPDGVKKIGDSVFYSCDSLKTISLPDSVSEIDYDAFARCKKLTEITIPSRVKVLRESLFGNCTSLKTVRLPNITTIRHAAFYNCSELKHIYYPGSESSWSKVQVIKDDRYDNSNAPLENAKLHTYFHYNDIANCNITIPYPSYGYTGKQIKPKNIKVTTCAGSKLSEGKHYTLSYENNVEYGTATVIVTGMGKYYGKLTATFEIKPAKVKNLKLEKLENRYATISWTKNPMADKYYVYNNSSVVYSSTVFDTAVVKVRDGYGYVNLKVSPVDIRTDPETGEAQEYVGNTAIISVRIG